MSGAERSSEEQEGVDRRLLIRPKEDVARMGREIYQRDIRWQVEPDHIGAVVSIDVETGSWAMGDESLEAVDRLREQRPEAVNIWCEWAGYKTLASMGGGMRRTK